MDNSETITINANNEGLSPLFPNGCLKCKELKELLKECRAELRNVEYRSCYRLDKCENVYLCCSSPKCRAGAGKYSEHYAHCKLNNLIEKISKAVEHE